MAKVTGKIDITASTEINGEMVSKTMSFDYPVFDEKLEGLIDYKHGAREVFLTVLARDTIELQDVVRRAIKAEHGITTTNGSSKTNKNRKALGL